MSMTPKRHPEPAAPMQGDDGYALPLVLMLTFLAVAITLGFVAKAQYAAESTGAMLGRRRAFYVADGMSRMALMSVARFLEGDFDPTTTDLQNPVNIPVPAHPDYNVETFSIQSLGPSFTAPISSGPFTGLDSRQKPVSIQIKARELTSDYASDITVHSTLAQISLFQFFMFGSHQIHVYSGPPMTVTSGRIHSNQDLCMGGLDPVRLFRVTTSGRLMAADDARCTWNYGTGPLINTGLGEYQLTADNGHGCVDCDGSGMNWKVFAQTTWRGHAQDVAHDVKALRLPITTSPAMQAGLAADGSTFSNANSLRLVIDPLQPGDPQDVLDERYAYKADLRILDGVWYLNDGTWPGMPIWSDHPGTYEELNPGGTGAGSAVDVGQDDLAALHSWTQVPKLFSHYEYDPTNTQLFDDNSGVVSYGTLFKDGSGAWSPGYWTQGPGSLTWTDSSSTIRPYFCDHCPGPSCAGTMALRKASTPYCYTESGEPQTGSQRLQGARGGFYDARVRHSANDLGKILPLNFDLKAFTNAMASTDIGELGDYFGSGTSFNGIVYISQSWPGSQSGYPDGLPSLWPSQGAITDDSHARSFGTAMTQGALPRNLCSESLGYDPYSSATPFGEVTAPFPDFVIPSCDPAKSPPAHVNALRLFNAATIDPMVFPRGLSIVTNLPMYILGAANSSSNTLSGTSTPWVPMMVGADALTLLSDNWDDALAPWDGTVLAALRLGTATEYNFQTITGETPTISNTFYSGGMGNLPRFLEDWAATPARIRGSFVAGFASVYQRQSFFLDRFVYFPPTRDWSFDDHLRSLSNQPPGAPRFTVFSVSRFDRL